MVRVVTKDTPCGVDTRVDQVYDALMKRTQVVRVATVRGVHECAGHCGKPVDGMLNRVTYEQWEKVDGTKVHRFFHFNCWA